MSSPFLELSTEQTRRLLALNPKCLESGLICLPQGDLQCELETLAGCTCVQARDIQVALGSEPVNNGDSNTLTLRLAEGTRFYGTAGAHELSEDAARAVLPYPPISLSPVLVYRAKSQSSSRLVPLVEPQLAVETASAAEAYTLQPVPSSRVLVAPTDEAHELILCPGYECVVPCQGQERTIVVVQDPPGSATVCALCPVCNAPNTQWNECETHGFHCNRHRQTCHSCKKNFCLLCSDEKCGVCQRHLCRECSGHVCSVCGKHTCVEHRNVCSECHGTFCSSCDGGMCAIGLTPLCKTCSGVCSSCGKTVRHRLLMLCYSCGKIVCPECRSICHIDGRVMCATHQGLCSECGSPICDTHRDICPVCGAPHCRNHYATCTLCGRKTCPKCSETGVCRQCLTLASLPAEDATYIKEKLSLLVSEQPFGVYSDIRGSQSPTGWLFKLSCGLTEYRVSTTADIGRILHTNKRSLMQRLFSRVFRR